MTVNFASLPFDEAIKFFRQKVSLPTEAWTDIWEGMHSRAFVVAGGMKSELLSDLRAAVDRGISEGTTITGFRKAFDETVKKNGWSYKGSRGWRTATSFNTNVRTAYAAGHYEQMTAPAVLKARPFWRYVGGLSEHPRALHLKWSGTVLRADDAWWHTHYPPNGWGCKCMVVSHSSAELERDGLDVSSSAPEDGHYEHTNKNTGEVISVPNGIDPGWAYNPGKAAWGVNEAKRLMEDKGPWVDLNPWGPDAYGLKAVKIEQARAHIGARVHGEEKLRQTLRDAIGGDEVALTDPAGDKTMVTQAIVDHMLADPKRLDGREAYFPFIKELIEAPAEIWVGFAQSSVSGRVGIRKKYIKAVRLDKDTALGLYAEIMNGLWVGGGFFRGDLRGLRNLRKGRLLWKR